MKITLRKPSISLIILMTLISLGFLYYQNKKVNDKLDSLIARKDSIIVQIERDSIMMIRLNFQIETNLKKIPEETKNLEQTKKQFDESKLKTITGYTIRSYSTTRGNRTYTKNYIKYR